MNPIQRALLAPAAIGASLLVAACTATPEATQGSPSETSQVAAPSGPSAPASAAIMADAPKTVATGLDAPWSVVFRDGTPLVSERDSGRILELSATGAARTLGSVPGVAGIGEGGLLGLAVDGRGRLYVYSTGAEGNRIQRFDVTGQPGSLALGEPETLLDGIAAASYHDGGRMAFGPDGMLYISTGDAGQRDSAQDLASLNGKILRMTPDGGIPEDNPFPGSLVYSYGHRNPQGFAWAADGTMFSTEFGHNAWDELNIITAGANYGWPAAEGITNTEGFTDPVQQWAPAEASPSGLVHIDGTLFIANLRGQVLRAVPVAEPSTSESYLDGGFCRIRDVAEAPDGMLWFVTNNTDGRGTPGPDDDRILSVKPERK
ncbi:PQQ-dependent sugar dehydrogenase [Arthrobacter oryzae]|uniref:PQQ-dependent sugar dehydrogenase n=1 Tax=Arthrobacter oryzae TaxID=409290 RepID=UPI00273C610B|nr:PQQ-dependent sugar dehydrogenase [Arthrobacter oryzae]WLQ05861.1 PQQ-dependent sugar dehydrogenase [Arthrobacter oryzae]